MFRVDLNVLHGRVYNPNYLVAFMQNNYENDLSIFIPFIKWIIAQIPRYCQAQCFGE